MLKTTGSSATPRAVAVDGDEVASSDDGSDEKSSKSKNPTNSSKAKKHQKLSKAKGSEQPDSLSSDASCVTFQKDDSG